MGMKPAGRVTERLNQRVSVLNREPMGMKLTSASLGHYTTLCFSAQPRADGDEALHPR